MNEDAQPRPPEGVPQNMRGAREAIMLLRLGLTSRWTTMAVRDAKTKFSDIRIYVSLASSELVWRSWKDNGNDGPPSEEFKRECLIEDCRTYRDLYLMAMELIPTCWEALYNGADYSGLLAETREGLDKRLDDDKHWCGVPSELKADRQALYRICGFKVNSPVTGG